MTKTGIISIIAIVVIILVVGAIFYLSAGDEATSTPSAINTNIAANTIKMTISTPAFENNQYMHERYTCDGIDVNPELHFGEVSRNAKSLVLILDDPDAPAGTFTHWLIWNIDPKTRIIKEGERPGGAIEGKNSAGKTGYIGPCPPSGTHHYRFKLYALNNTISVSQNIRQVELESLIGGMALESAQLVGLYQRSSIPR